ncbi:MAG: glycosyltransferase family 4 protein, partial [Rhabdochlamydiaceae bacterium]
LENPVFTITNIVKTGFSSNPFLLTGHRSKKMQEILAKLLHEQQFDIIHVETFYVAQNLPKTNIPVVLVEHNIEYSIYNRFANTASSLLRPLLLLDIKKLKKAEEQAWKKADHIVAVSEQEKEIIQKYTKAVSVVENGVDLEKFRMKDIAKQLKNKQKKILFIGDFSYIQNIDAATFIIREIAPLMRKLSGDMQIQFWVKGRSIPDSIKNLSHDSDIIYDEDTTVSTLEIFTQADILLAPIRVGGGTQYKILESMACGTPVITTQLGNEGINGKENKEIVLGETATQLAQQCHKLLTDATLYTKIAKDGRSLVEKNFNWELITQRLEKVYQETVKKN